MKNRSSIRSFSRKLTEKVSIVIPFYNCNYVDQAIMSALNQTYKNIEIILVDDGSTTNIEKLTPFMKKLKYIKKENGGTATALNKGIKHLSGDYFVWLSSDDVLHPSKVEIQLRFMKLKSAKFSFTNFNWIDNNNNPIKFYVSPKFSDTVSFYKYMKRGCPINGSTVMIKSELFSEVGLFDEHLRYTHDYDLWNRIALKYDMPFLNQSLTSYRIHQEMGTRKYPEAITKEVTTVKKRYSQNLNQLIAKAMGNKT